MLSGAYPRLIDEWQEVFELWDAIQTNVDNDSTKGKFILTGFATIDKNKYIHSGCGRIARLKMRPMSLFESCHSSGLISLKDICDENAKNILTGDVNLKDLLNYIFSGGWSPLLN